jgi:phage baseplate assembly protein W
LATETIKYSDLDLDFLPNPITKDVPLKYDVEAVKRSIRSLVFTNKYERLFQPDIDAGIHKLLFENFGTIQIVTLRNRLEQAIVNYEPRVTEVNVKTRTDEENHLLVIDVIFRVRNIPQLETLRIELQRIR